MLEYAQDTIEADKFEERLNAWGRDGWRLHSCFPVAGNPGEAHIAYMLCVLERPKVTTKKSPMGAK